MSHKTEPCPVCHKQIDRRGLQAHAKTHSQATANGTPGREAEALPLDDEPPTAQAGVVVATQPTLPDPEPPTEHHCPTCGQPVTRAAQLLARLQGANDPLLLESFLGLLEHMLLKSRSSGTPAGG